MTGTSRLERWLIVLIAAHSCLVGAGLCFLTDPVLRLAGWVDPGPRFFPQQAGVFHFVVAAGYLLEHFRHGGVSFLLLTKGTAVCFLLGMMLAGPQPWAVPVSAGLDALMAGAVVLVRRRG